MRKYAPIFLDIFLKLRALTSSQLLSFCDHSASRQRVYENVRALKKQGYVQFLYDSKSSMWAYAATQNLLEKIHGDLAHSDGNLRTIELSHTISCSQVAISLMRYSFVSGFSSEHEVSPNEIKEFCFNRRPDGIVQLTRGDMKYELAVEVESSVKALPRIEKILSSYQKTLESNQFHCAGVLIVATCPSAYNAYENLIKKMPESTQERIILHDDLDLKNLNAYFGVRLNHVLDNAHFPARRLRSVNGGTIQYLPIKSINAVSPDRINRHI